MVSKIPFLEHERDNAPSENRRGAWFPKLRLVNKGLGYQLTAIFGLFFLFPICGFIIFIVRHNIFHDLYLTLFFLGVLVFLFSGIVLLRKLLDHVSKMSEGIPRDVDAMHSGTHERKSPGKLRVIGQSKDAVSHELNCALVRLEQNRSEATVLREVADLCFVTHDPEEVLYTILERSLMLLDADIGSILMLDDPDGKSFIVHAAIGHGDTIKVGDRIDFETSIAKHAVMNKAPIVVEDIERDSRFGRASRAHYGTKSFICAPIKTSGGAVGVLTVSRRKSGQIFTEDDLVLLMPLVSMAAFSYENLHLMQGIAEKSRYQEFARSMLRTLTSGYSDDELLQVVLNEIHEIVQCDRTMVMAIDDHQPDVMCVISWRSGTPGSIPSGRRFEFKGTILDKALRQDGILTIRSTDTLTGKIEREFFAGPKGTCHFLMPLKFNGITKGLIALSTLEPAISPEAHDIMKCVPDMVSIAMERSRLSATVAKRDQELGTIKQIGNALASSNFDIRQVLNYTMAMIRMLMDVEAGSLYLVDKDRLEFAAALNSQAAYQNRLQLKFGEGIAGHVAARGTPIIMNDAAASPFSTSMVYDPGESEAASVLCVPVITHGKVAGVIEVLNKVNGDFDSSDLELLESIGSSVGIAIENAGLYEEMSSIAEKERGIRNIFQKFVPKEVLEKIIYSSKTGEQLVEELKTLTLLNIDIRDFSSLGRRLGPQKTVSLLNRFFSTMGDIVFRYSGIVDKYLGDGFLAVFGAPVSSTRDADNAIAAALEMQKCISDLNDHFTKEYGASICIGISVHTGEAVVGNIGFDMKMDYTVIGDSVNDVFRLQELTKPIPNSILITDNTLRAAQSRLETAEIESSSYSGTFLRSRKVYEVLGLNDGHTDAG